MVRYSTGLRNAGNTGDIKQNIAHAMKLAGVIMDGLSSAGTIEEIEAWRTITTKGHEAILDELDMALTRLSALEAD